MSQMAQHALLPGAQVQISKILAQNDIPAHVRGKEWHSIYQNDYTIWKVVTLCCLCECLVLFCGTL
jgi:hypothetical protein